MVEVLIQTVAPIVGTLLGTVLVAAAAFLVKWLRKQTAKIENEMLKEWAEVVVNAVEQADNTLIKKGVANLQRPDKKTEAVKTVKDVLAKAGIKVSDEAVEAAIEAAVLKLKKGK